MRPLAPLDANFCLKFSSDLSTFSCSELSADLCGESFRVCPDEFPKRIEENSL